MCQPGSAAAATRSRSWRPSSGRSRLRRWRQERSSGSRSGSAAEARSPLPPFPLEEVPAAPSSARGAPDKDRAASGSHLGIHIRSLQLAGGLCGCARDQPQAQPQPQPQRGSPQHPQRGSHGCRWPPPLAADPPPPEPQQPQRRLLKRRGFGGSLKLIGVRTSTGAK